MRLNIRKLVMACVFGILSAGSSFADTCTCDSPCSGSKTCSGGCYAYCEENPENSGRHVCVKGCASENTSSSAIPDNTSAPADTAAPASESTKPE
jgi:hypothetical protein